MYYTVRITCFAFLLLTLSGIRSAGQEPVLRHFSISNGLASNRTHHVAQDSLGFIWVTTETGISRFNGSSFISFYRGRNGLGDNEAMNAFTDSRGRVWFYNFSSPPGYFSYQDRRFHSVDEAFPSSNLQPGDYHHVVNQVYEDKQGSLWSCYGDIIKFSASGCQKIKRPGSYFLHTGEEAGGGQVFWEKNGLLFTVSDTALRLFAQLQGLPPNHNIHSVMADDEDWLLINRTNNILLYNRYLQMTKSVTTRLNIEKIYKGRAANAGYWVVASCNGVFWYSSRDSLFRNLPRHHFLPGKCVNTLLFDREGIVWFSTSDDGIYSLFNSRVLTYGMPSSISSGTVISVSGNGKGTVWAGTGDGRLMQAGGPVITVLKEKKSSLRITDILCDRAGRVWLCSDDSAYLIEKGKTPRAIQQKGLSLKAGKNMAEDREGMIWLATCCALLKIDPAQGYKVKQVYGSRTTAVCCDAMGNTWVADPLALYRVNNDSLQAAGLRLSPGCRISSLITSHNNLLWVGTWGSGIKLLWKGRLIDSIEAGIAGHLPGNVCKALYPGRRGVIWAATNKGLCRISVTGAEPPFSFQLQTFNRSNGLTDDDINDVYEENGRVWVATASGLCVFSDTLGAKLPKPGSFVEGVTVLNSTPGILMEGESLPWFNNNLEFHFTALALRSLGRLIYQVKLEGFDSAWRNVEGASIQYTSLSPGNYRFYVRTANLDGDWGPASDPFVFTIKKAFWQKNAFRIFALLLALTILVLFYRAMKARTRYKADMRRRLAELRLEAVRAQMNPHFIYNCLNSIQYYLSENDKESAQRYLSGFGKLIRQTLDYSRRNTIRLSEEIAFLDNYLSLEKMRLEDHLQYEIIHDEIANADQVLLPPLLLQPYVENAIRHGLKPKTAGPGNLTIQFTAGSAMLHCLVSDNGVGRQPAAGEKTGLHGMEINKGRIASLEQLYGSRINLRVRDKTVEKDGETGTEITLDIPLTREPRE